MRLLFIGIGLAILLLSYGAMAQPCVTPKSEEIDKIDIKLAAITKNLQDWQLANRNHADLDRTDYLLQRLSSVQLHLARANDLAYVSELAVGRQPEIIRYANGVLGSIKEFVTRERDVINSWLQRISHPYVVAEGREARSSIEAALIVLANCQPFERRR